MALPAAEGDSEILNQKTQEDGPHALPWGEALSGTIDESPLSTIQLFSFTFAQLVLWAAHAAGFLEVSFALPCIQEDFGVTEADVQWVVASFILVWGCVALLSGRLCDVLGKKKGYIFGCSTYVFWNVLCAVMPNLASLNVCRGFKGISSSFLLPSSLSLTGTLVPVGRPRTLAFVAIGCGGAAGASAGQLLAGLFIAHTRLRWRACFLSTGLPCLISLAITWYIVPADPPISATWEVDFLGAFAIGTGLFLLLLSMTLAQNLESGWSTSFLPSLLVGSAVFLALFAWRQWYLAKAASRPDNTKCPPLIPLGLISWKNRNLSIIYVAAFLTWGATDSWFVYVSYYCNEVLRQGPFETGLKTSVTVFSGTLAALVVACTISRVPPRVLMTSLVLLSGIADVLFAVRKVEWEYWKGDLWALLVRWYGTDVIVSAGNAYISQHVEPLGYVIALALSNALRDYAERSAVRRGESEVEASLKGLQAAFWTLTAFSLTSALVIICGMKGWDYLDEGKNAPEPQSDAEGIESIDATERR